MKKNVIVGQSGGPTAVINASLAGVYKTAKDMGADTIYGMRYGIQGLLEKKIVDLGEKIRNDMDVELLKRTPASFLGSCRYKLPEISADKTIYERIFTILEELEIMAFFYIGGNDSMDTIKKLSDYAQTVGSPIRFIGVPKTIDNDLVHTDHTPGFGSAARFVAAMVREISTDAAVYDNKQSVTIVEIMGRHAGWLTAAGVLARQYEGDNPVLIYLPEIGNAMLNAEDEEHLEKMVPLIPKAVSEHSIVTVTDRWNERVSEILGYHGSMLCSQACYTRGEPLPVRHKDIRQLTVEEIPYVAEHYHLGDETYVRERIVAGDVFGIYIDGKLCGFIGCHNDGSMGMLYVEDAYRRQGLAASLEGYLINKQREQGMIPYAHIVNGNEASIQLQERLGLNLSDPVIWWLYK